VLLTLFGMAQSYDPSSEQMILAFFIPLQSQDVWVCKGLDFCIIKFSAFWARTINIMFSNAKQQLQRFFWKFVECTFSRWRTPLEACHKSTKMLFRPGLLCQSPRSTIGRAIWALLDDFWASLGLKQNFAKFVEFPQQNQINLYSIIKVLSNSFNHRKYSP